MADDGDPISTAPSPDGRRGHPNLVRDRDAPSYGSYAAAVVAGRKLLGRFIPGDFFADPAFDMLLDLFAAAEAGEPRSPACCAAAARVSEPTARRYLDLLGDAGLVARTGDAGDAGQARVSLTPSAIARMQAWLETISSIPLRRDLAR